jgi:hypothetical protein
MKRMDGYTDFGQASCIWEGSTLIVKPVEFAKFVGSYEMPEMVMGFVPSYLEPSVQTSDPMVQVFTSQHLIMAYFEMEAPNSAVEIETEGFSNVQPEQEPEGVIN